MSEVSNKRFVHFNGTKQEFIDGGYPDHYNESIVFINGDGNESNNTIYTHGEYYGQGGVIARGYANHSAVLTGETTVLGVTYKNEALNEGCVSLGANSKAGLKGYYFTYIDFNTNQIWLHNEQFTSRILGALGGWKKNSVSDVNRCGWSKDDVISFTCGGHYDNSATIVDVVDNVITVDKIPFTIDDVPSTIISIEAANNKFDECSVFCVKKYNIGTVELGGNAFAIGTNTQASNAVAYTEGYNTVAYGKYSHAEGNETEAGYNAHSEGYKTKATGHTSHAEGQETQSIGDRSHVEGRETIAIGNNSHAEGYKTKANGSVSHAEGRETEAGENAHSEGYKTKATGGNSHAEGESTEATNYNAHSEGKLTVASGNTSHAEGLETQATGNYSHAEGESTEASGKCAHAEGNTTTASGESSHSEGATTVASGKCAHAEGLETQATGNYSHAEGDGTIASGKTGHAEGYGSRAEGIGSHAEGGYYNSSTDYKIGGTASGVASHAEGCLTEAIAKYSHAEGYDTTANGVNSHAEGRGTSTSGEQAHAEGRNTIAKGYNSHAEGYGSKANGDASHAEGGETVAEGKYSHTSGYYTIAYNSYEAAFGTYNNSVKGTTIFTIGIGDNESSRENALEVQNDGGCYIKNLYCFFDGAYKSITEIGPKIIYAQYTSYTINIKHGYIIIFTENSSTTATYNIVYPNNVTSIMFYVCNTSTNEINFTINGSVKSVKLYENECDQYIIDKTKGISKKINLQMQDVSLN